jgi:hypothetical protein
MKRLTVTLLMLTLAACAADTADYPSLARRDAERTMDVPQAVPSATPVPLPPGADQTARLAGLVDQARGAHRRFDSRRSKAERAVAAGGARGSESWGTANVALADLESARSEAMIALADLDQLYAKARIDGADISAIAAARDQVMGWIGEEDRVLAGLRGRL